MCAIVDVSAAFEVFGSRQTDAGRKFRDWLDNGSGQLVVGGKVLKELKQNGNFRRWFQEARRSSGRVRQFRAATVREQEERLDRGLMRSNDQHVVALALVSGARLLYTNDQDLIDDFKNPKIVARPHGKIYTTKESNGEITAAHKRLLAARDLCRAPRT